MKKIHDISLTISSHLPVWEGDPRIKLERVSKIEEGSESNVTDLKMRVHSSTHIDAPLHFIEGGKTVDQLSLETLVGPVQVVEIPEDCELITAKTIQSVRFLPGIERILFKTRNSRLWVEKGAEFQKNFVALDAETAQILVDKGYRLVGIDYLSVAPFYGGVLTHRTLLGAGVIVLEGLDLSGVPGGLYTLYCLPLKILGSDGAPARVILVEE
jgi:arylformamidase